MSDVERDMEQLLRDLRASGDWEDEHEEILLRWRGRRGEEGMGGWRWWWKTPDEDLYRTDHGSRTDAIRVAREEEPGATEIDLIEARDWSDDIGVDHDETFAVSRNHERLSLAANDAEADLR